MNKEQQRIAIAEACGFKCSEYSDELGQLVAEFTPDYLNDLNAMHEAEKVLRDDREAAFRGWLWLAHGQPEMRCAIVHATAAQRAEAFLKTIGKWEDDK
jgi:hypothetical protein